MGYPSVQDGFNAAYEGWLRSAQVYSDKPRAIAWHFYNKGLSDTPEVGMDNDTTKTSGAPDTLPPATIDEYLDRPALKAFFQLELAPVTNALLSKTTLLLKMMAANRYCECSPVGVCESCGAILQAGITQIAASIEAAPIVVGIDKAQPGSDRTAMAVSVPVSGSERKTYPIPEGFLMVPKDGHIMAGDHIWAELESRFQELDADHWLVGMPVNGKTCVIRRVNTRHSHGL